MNDVLILSSSQFNGESLCRFFLEHADTSYISHSEIQEGRAQSLTKWSSDILSVLEEEFNQAIKNPHFQHANVFGIMDGDTLIAMALVEYFPNDHKKFASLSDIVVKSTYRKQGLALSLTNHICEVIKKEGFSMIFAESNLQNGPAHYLLEKSGFQAISKVFMKELK